MLQSQLPQCQRALLLVNWKRLKNSLRGLAFAIGLFAPRNFRIQIIARTILTDVIFAKASCTNG